MTTATEIMNLTPEQIEANGEFTILVDQDGVIGDWQHTYDTLLALQMPHVQIIPREEIKIFKAQKLYAEEHHEGIAKMMNTPGFYRNLLPIEGAVKALKEMKAAGYNVRICTAPYVTHETCASEKMQWIGEHLGDEWKELTIITSDKTLVRGDVLIDDKPKISGSMVPVWKHVVFDAPYNRHLELRLNKWADWQTVIPGLLGQK